MLTDKDCRWPYATVNFTDIVNQTRGWSNWVGDLPPADEWTNTTVVDDIFGWGTETNRSAPMFQMYPTDYNTIGNFTTGGTLANAGYLLGKNAGMDNYTLCQMYSWPAIQCSTHLNVSGSTSMAMSASCSQDVDYYPATTMPFKSNPDAYVNTMALEDSIGPSVDWRNMVQSWTTSISLNGGIDNANASIARLLTQLAVRTNQLNTTMPSLAEALAALAANTLIAGALDTPFIHYWNVSGSTMLTQPMMVSFKARVRNQEYASWHTEPWQGIFYVILAAAFALNLLCLVYLCSLGLVKDFLEPTTLFELATAHGAGHNVGLAATPELAQVSEKGGGKRKRGSHMGTPYLLNYHEDKDHFFFEEAADGGKGTPRLATGLDVEGDQMSKRKSFQLGFESMRRLPQ